MKTLFCILLFLFPAFSFAENRQPKVDSLQLVLMHAHEDTNNVLTRIELSTQLYNMDEYGLALEHSMLAKGLAEKLGFKSGIASALKRIGTIYTEQGRYPEAVQYLLKSFKLYESLKDANGIFMVNSNLGTLYYFQNDYAKALGYYLNAHSYKEDGRTCSNIGMTYFQQEYYTRSLTFFQKALVYYQSTSDKNGISSMLNNIGAVYEEENKNDSALVYYFKALKIKEEIQDNQGICDALASIGDIYSHQKKYKEALNYEHNSLTLAKQIGYINSIKATEEVLSGLYFQLGDFAKALEHYKQFTIAKDSLFNEDNTKRMVGAEKDFEFQQKEEHTKMEQDKKDAIQAEQFKAQKFQKNVFIVGFMLVAIFLLILFRGYKKIKIANNIISEQKKKVDEQHKDIRDSIQYASRIQKAIMLPDVIIKEILPEHFLLWKSRDAVSGDFYFIQQYKDKLIVAIADATGHGTNGCLISILGSNILSEIVKEGETMPSQILDKLNYRFNESLHKTNDDSIRDGMDISLMCYDLSTNHLMWSGANNPLWIIRSGTIIEMKGDKFAIGQTYKEASYTNHEVQLQKGDVLYAFSDGICDQFNPDGKKFMKKRLRDLLLSVQDNSMCNQREIINGTIEDWKLETEQTDDILIMGLKI